MKLAKNILRQQQQAGYDGSVEAGTTMTGATNTSHLLPTIQNKNKS
jgi:hypothetical protein